MYCRFPKAPNGYVQVIFTMGYTVTLWGQNTVGQKLLKARTALLKLGRIKLNFVLWKDRAISKRGWVQNQVITLIGLDLITTKPLAILGLKRYELGNRLYKVEEAS